ncbi:hypothetical protein [Parasitella parasitica]|uniref:PH domain-containing protein n=1 Tax=Parasitella parasitica TaxID=35722 RepID=A0A0B7MXN2_9FUNG|nr:hypothetical protein [Parasitella parasitica]
MCNISDPRILNAYISIIEDEPTDWLILGYKDTRDVISLYSSGIHGLGEFRDNLTNEILFGFVRIEDKFIQITYVPDSVSGVRRARALVHSRSVAGVLELSHAQFTASSLSDLSDSNVRTRLKLGQNQAPNRPRSASKRASFVVQQRRRRSGTYSPLTPSSPSPMSERNLKIHLSATEEPYSYYEDGSDRMTATPTPSTPTSVASSSYNPNVESNYFAVATENNTFNAAVDEQERKRYQDHTEAMLQFQLSKKKELEEARFRQFQRDQHEERSKREEQEQQKSLVEEPRIEKKEEKRKTSLMPQQEVALQKDEKKALSLQQQMLAKKEDQEKKLPLQPPSSVKQETEKTNPPSHQEVAINQEEENKPFVQTQLTARQKELPRWQQELIQRKLKKLQEQQTQKDQQPFSHPNRIELKKTQPNDKVQNPLQQFRKPVLSKIQIPERLASPTCQTPLQMVQLKSSNKESSLATTERSPPLIREALAVRQKSNGDSEIKKQQDKAPSPAIAVPEPSDVKVPSVPALISSTEEKETTATTATLMAGFISAQTNVSPFWKRRYFEINSHSLLLYKDEMSKKAMSFVDFSTAERIAPSDEDDDTFVPNSYTIHTKQGDSYQLLADDKKFGNQIYATLKELILSDCV